MCDIAEYFTHKHTEVNLLSWHKLHVTALHRRGNAVTNQPSDLLLPVKELRCSFGRKITEIEITCTQQGAVAVAHFFL